MARVVPAVARAMSILELFLGDDAELSAREITESLGLPRTTVHELTRTLVELGYLVASPRSNGGSFQLGVKVLQLGLTYENRLDLAGEGAIVANLVADECNETVNVAILDKADIVYVVKVDSTRSVRMVSAPGRRIPAHCTAVGKILLSALTSDQLDAIYPSASLPVLTPASISRRGQLLEELDHIRSKGIAFEAEESTPHVACVAAPIYDRSDRMVAGLSISVPVVRWSDRTPEGWAALAISGARRVSDRLGATKDAGK